MLEALVILKMAKSTWDGLLVIDIDKEVLIRNMRKRRLEQGLGKSVRE